MLTLPKVNHRLSINPYISRTALWIALTIVASTFSRTAAQGPASPLDLSTTTPRSWAEAAALNEEHIIKDDGSFPLRYHVRRVDARADTTRDVIESRQGLVARMIQRNGQPLTPEEDAAERSRLTDLLDSPKDFIKRHKRDTAARGYALELVRQFPRATIFSYAPGQPQRPNFRTPQVVLDCTPDPSYKPPTIVTQVLTGIQGRIWIDRETAHVLRVEGSVLRAVDFGWGFLARIYPGGTVEFEQINTGGNRWAYASLRENVTIREMMVRTVQQHSTMTTADFQLLPAPIDYQEAIHILLATPLKLAK